MTRSMTVESAPRKNHVNAMPALGYALGLDQETL